MELFGSPKKRKRSKSAGKGAAAPSRDSGASSVTYGSEERSGSGEVGGARDGVSIAVHNAPTHLEKGGQGGKRRRGRDTKTMEEATGDVAGKNDLTESSEQEPGRDESSDDQVEGDMSDVSSDDGPWVLCDA